MTAGGQHHSKKRNARAPASRVRTEVDPNRRFTLPSLLVVSPDINITRLQRWRCLAHHLLTDDNRGHVHTGMVILPMEVQVDGDEETEFMPYPWYLLRLGAILGVIANQVVNLHL